MKPSADTASRDIAPGGERPELVHRPASAMPATLSDATVAWNTMQQLVFNEDRRRAAAAELGMPFSRVRALRRVAWADGITQRELAESMSSDAAALTVSLDDLEQRGLVVRAPHPDDRRVKVVHCTPTGLSAAAAAEQVMSRPPEALVALSPEELSTLVELLAKL